MSRLLQTVSREMAKVRMKQAQEVRGLTVGSLISSQDQQRLFHTRVAAGICREEDTLMAAESGSLESSICNAAGCKYQMAYVRQFSGALTHDIAQLKSSFSGTSGLHAATGPSSSTLQCPEEHLTRVRCFTQQKSLSTVTPPLTRTSSMGRSQFTQSHMPTTTPTIASDNSRVSPHPHPSSYSTHAPSSVSSSPRPRSIPMGGFLALNNIGDNEGAKEQKTRVGRGIGSGKGKTAGKGHKGQKARSGPRPKIGFEGGQTPLRLRIPKRGFHNPFSMSFQEVNLEAIERKIQEGVIDPTQLITMKTLKEAKIAGKSTRDGVKLLGRGAEGFTRALHIEVSRVSSKAKAAVESLGGTVTCVHYNQLGLRALLKPEWFEKKGRVLPRAARPPPRLLPKVDCIGRLPAPTEPLPMKGLEPYPGKLS
eukprot:jgi/Mesen1/7653/ME000400S06848